MHRRPVYVYLLNVPSFYSRYFNKIRRTSRLGRLLALSLEILCFQIATKLSDSRQHPTLVKCRQMACFLEKLIHVHVVLVISDI